MMSGCCFAYILYFQLHSEAVFSASAGRVFWKSKSTFFVGNYCSGFKMTSVDHSSFTTFYILLHLSSQGMQSLHWRNSSDVGPQICQKVNL